MRLSEEIVTLLQTLNHGAPGSHSNGASDLHSSANAPAEIIAECEHEGLVEQLNGHTQIQLTESGRELLSRISSRLSSADQIAIGKQVRIAYLSSRDYPRFQKLSALGLSPGVPIRVQQRFPSFVILCEETEIALEEEIAKDIFVWQE